MRLYRLHSWSSVFLFITAIYEYLHACVCIMLTVRDSALGMHSQQKSFCLNLCPSIILTAGRNRTSVFCEING